MSQLENQACIVSIICLSLFIINFKLIKNFEKIVEKKQIQELY